MTRLLPENCDRKHFHTPPDSSPLAFWLEDRQLSRTWLFSLCPCFVRGKERGRNPSRVSREALEKPCTIHEKRCAQSGAFASSLARASNFPGFSWPTKASNAKISGTNYTKFRRTLPSRKRHRAGSSVAFAENRAFPVLYIFTCARQTESDTIESGKAPCRLPPRTAR